MGEGEGEGVGKEMRMWEGERETESDRPGKMSTGKPFDFPTWTKATLQNNTDMTILLARDKRKHF